ncbi:InlB B-repeat-containing protein, partial [Luminiphilus sp.]
AGISSTPGQLADLIDDLVLGEGDIPPVNIIIDDLFYPTQNPFEFDEVSEAIERARGDNVLYISAAGDHGHLDRGANNNTSSTHTAELQKVSPVYQVADDSVWAAFNALSFGGNVHAFVDPNGENIGFLELETELSDLCFFWSQKPAPNSTSDDPFVYVYSDSDEELEWWIPSGPGGCLNGGTASGGGLPAGSKVILEWFGAENPNLLLHGLGAPVGVAAFTAAGATDGGVRGHASSPDAVTVSSVSIETSSAITLYAQWVEQSTLIFDVQGGEGGPENITGDVDSYVEIPDAVPTKEGSAFVGWSASSDGVGSSFEAGNSFQLPSSGTTTLYAQWDPARVTMAEDTAAITLSFDLQGGSGGPEAQQGEEDEEILLPDDVPTRQNYTFDSWNTDADGTGVEYQPGATFTFLNEDSTLYAVWTPNTVTIAFDFQGGDIPADPNPFDGISGSAGDDESLPTDSPTKTGRVFLGWNTESNGSGTLYAAGASYTIPDLGTLVGTVTLYAQWNAYPFTISYSAEGGTGGPASQGGVFGSTIILSSSPEPTRENYRFDGWSTAADGSGDTFADGDSYTVPDRITLAPYSSGGQQVFQYGWQDVGVGDTADYVEWQTTSVDGNRPFRKPNVAAVGSGNFVSLDPGGAPQETLYSGTSHSAAAVAGIAALYWELRATELATIDGEIGLGAGVISTLLPEEVRAALRDAAQYDGADPYVPTSPLDLAQSLLIGDGAIDVPTVVTEDFLGQPLSAGSISHVVGVAAIELDFTKSADDFFEQFAYWLECEGVTEALVDPTLEEIPTPNGAYVVPSDSASDPGELDTSFLPEPVDTVAKAPLILDATPAGEVVCTVTPQRGEEKWTPSIISTEAITPVDVTPVAISLTSKALGVEFTMTDSADYPVGTVVTYAAQCSAGDVELLDEVDLDATLTRSILADPGTEVTCSASVTAQYKTATAVSADSSPVSVTATASTAAAPLITVTPDLGGVMISWVNDPDLASAVSQSSSLTCIQGDEILLDDFVLEADITRYFLETETETPVECTVTSTISGTGISDVVVTSSAEQATPDPSSLGLPIWLLYQATQ